MRNRRWLTWAILLSAGSVVGGACTVSDENDYVYREKEPPPPVMEAGVPDAGGAGGSGPSLPVVSACQICQGKTLPPVHHTYPVAGGAGGAGGEAGASGATNAGAAGVAGAPGGGEGGASGGEAGAPPVLVDVTPSTCEDGYVCQAVGERSYCLPSCDSTCPTGFTCTLGVCIPDVPTQCCLDMDGDRYGEGVTCLGTDCDENDANVSSGAADVCNGKDDDCNPTTVDGSGDPLFGAACDGPDSDGCEEGTWTCEAEELVCSDITDDGTETCNALDDDCDGEIDEGFSHSTCGIGACAREGLDCDQSSCTPGQPSPELCNDIDDNCNSTKDEDSPKDMCEREFGQHPEAVWNCTTGVCSITSCTGNKADINGDISDGCECTVPANSTSCATGTTVSVPLGRGPGNPVTVQGLLVNVGDENWFDVTYTAPALGTTWNPRAELGAGSSSGVMFDVVAVCGDSATCGSGFAAAATQWSRLYTYTTPPARRAIPTQSTNARWPRCCSTNARLCSTP